MAQLNQICIKCMRIIHGIATKARRFQKVVLIYPYSKEFLPIEFHSLTDVPDTNGVQINVRYLDLYGDSEREIRDLFIKNILIRGLNKLNYCFYQ